MHRNETGYPLKSALTFFSGLLKHAKLNLFYALIPVLITPGISYSTTPDTDPRDSVHHFRLLAFGTYIEFMVAGVSVNKALQAKKIVATQFLNMHRQWHSSHNSLVATLNQQLPDGQWHPLPHALRDLLKRSVQISIQSKHSFNPAIGRLVNLWGFNNSLKPRSRPPTKTEIKHWTQRKARMSDLQIKGNLIRSRNPAVQLDFGAIAKGFAIDRVTILLKKRGFKHFIINAGGDLKAIGRHPARAWRIAVRDPANKSQIIAGIKIKNEEAVFTSGDYERYFIFKGKRYHHIINPLNGQPIQHTRSVTVLHISATLADAAATALFIAGPEHWPAMAKKLGIQYVMLIDHKGVIHLSHAMKLRIQLFKHLHYRIRTIHLRNASLK